jgi:hypothetical protein
LRSTRLGCRPSSWSAASRLSAAYRASSNGRCFRSLSRLPFSTQELLGLDEVSKRSDPNQDPCHIAPTTASAEQPPPNGYAKKPDKN